MNKYACLNKQVFREKEYSIVPIRLEDRYSIMKWRNEQLYHLRQLKPLTIDEQDKYFSTVVTQLFNQEQPNQILFSYLENDVCIGYGGLVHINWYDQIAELSFIMDTQLENNYFEKHWTTFLTLIEEVAFQTINLHKIFTYAFDLRPQLYKVLEKCQFVHEAVLKEHVKFGNSYIDVFIHSKINENTRI